jgi:uncharacterized protein (DUF488 family)
VPQYTIYTVGHGQLSWEAFAHLLEPYRIELVVDVRSFPYVEAAPWFNRDRLEQQLRRAGLEYLWLGGHLGPLTEKGKVDYVAKEHEPRYREGISLLLTLAAERNVCLLASSPDPLASHRHQLIAQTLLRQDVGVVHLMEEGGSVPAQPDLFHSRR